MLAQKYMKNLKLALFLISLAVLPVIGIWIPFLIGSESVLGIPIPEGGMQIIAANYDGPLYIAVAKSFYNLEHIAANFSFPLPLEYYAAHFPLYPVTIRIFGIILGYPWGMLTSTLAGATFAMFYFYALAKRSFSHKSALWLCVVFAVFPARWLIVRSVGSPEPWFIGLIIASIFHFQRKEYWLAGIFGAFAQLTKSPGILLFVSYGCALILPRLKELATNHSAVKWVKSLEYKAYPLLLMPLSLLALFYLYSIKFGDFFAYFNSGDNIHLFFPPFQIFNYSQPWVNTHWLEEIIFIYLFGLFGVIKLAQQKRTLLAWFVGIFVATIFFVSHRDLMRYSLPVLPYLLLAFEKQINTKEFRIILAILVIPVYLFSLAYIVNNVMPISDWEPLL
jgi:hypothetical protein